MKKLTISTMVVGLALSAPAFANNNVESPLFMADKDSGYINLNVINYKSDDSDKNFLLTGEYGYGISKNLYAYGGIGYGYWQENDDSDSSDDFTSPFLGAWFRAVDGDWKMDINAQYKFGIGGDYDGHQDSIDLGFRVGQTIDKFTMALGYNAEHESSGYNDNTTYQRDGWNHKIYSNNQMMLDKNISANLNADYIFNDGREYWYDTYSWTAQANFHMDKTLASIYLQRQYYDENTGIPSMGTDTSYGVKFSANF